MASPGSCNAPQPAEQLICLGKGRSFVSQKGPSAYFTRVETKQICSSGVPKEQLRLERISEVTQSVQGRADGRGIPGSTAYKGGAFVAGDWSQAAREM